MRGGQGTDEARERALGRVPVWLPLEDVRLLAKHCFCEDRGNEKIAPHSWRCWYLRTRVDAAPDKAGSSRSFLEEAVAANLDGLVFTLVWRLDLTEDRELIASYIELVRSRHGGVRFVELFAEQGERLIRNSGESRLDHKRSKRDLESSRAHLLQLDADYVMNTDATHRTLAEELLDHQDYIRIDNTRRDASDVAAQIVERFSLRSTG